LAPLHTHEYPYTFIVEVRREGREGVREGGREGGVTVVPTEMFLSHD